MKKEVSLPYGVRLPPRTVAKLAKKERAKKMAEKGLPITPLDKYGLPRSKF